MRPRKTDGEFFTPNDQENGKSIELPKYNPELAETLATFNYEKLQGEEFERYMQFAEGKKVNPTHPQSLRSGGLPMNKTYDYAVYLAFPIWKELYPGMKDSPKMVDGIMLYTAEPHIACTRIDSRRAAMFNHQIYNANSVSPTMFYLLKK